MVEHSLQATDVHPGGHPGLHHVQVNEALQLAGSLLFHHAKKQAVTPSARKENSPAGCALPSPTVFIRRKRRS